ncbi:MAG: helix-turn-helix domain-containing protein [Candidatus Peregrinibacteria bacterium]
MSNIVSNIYLDRGEASKVLKVSTRTLDRYVRRYKFKIKKKGRKVFLKRTDVDRIINDHVGKFLDDFNRLKTDSKHLGQVGQDVQQLTVKDVKVESVRVKEETVYKELYFELKKELKERQDRLEAATYRVGQLESQLKNMVPMLDYNRKDKELHEAKIALENRVAESQETIKKIQGVVRAERIAKWVYLSLVGLLLIAEPIVFLVWAFS